MITLKSDVRARHIRAEMMVPLILATEIWGHLGQDVEVTSITEGDHRDRSFHYNGLAVDLRTHGLPPGTAHTVVATMTAALGPFYQVVFEDEGLPNEHIHIEYDDGQEQPRLAVDRL